MLDVEQFYAKDRAAWRDWLITNHENKQSVWLVYDKGDKRTLQWEDIVQEALCFGWIDSRPGKVSETQSKLYVSKRKSKSVWSKINKEHVKKMQDAGLMMPAGQRIIEEAKQNGAWDALNQSDALIMPAELAEKLANNKTAQVFYDGLSNSSKKIILEWIYSAKTDNTRSKRIDETVVLAAQQIKAHHYRQ